MNKAVDWDRIQRRVGDIKVERSRLVVNEEKEFWFDVAPLASGQIGVWREGHLVRESWPSLMGRQPLSRREFLWHRDSALFVDIEVRGDHAQVRRGHLNSTAMHASTVAASKVDGLLQDFRQWGFQSGSPWHTGPREVVRRTYAGPSITTLWIDATCAAIHSSQTSQLEVVECTSRGEAIQAIEARIEALESQQGYGLVRVEVLPSAYDNPPLEGLENETPTSVLADLAPVPEDAKDAVDAAIELLQAVCDHYPHGHLVVEMEWDDAPRVATLEEGEGLASMHADRFSQWQARRMTCDRLALAELTSSFDYFARRYGSISWLVTRNLDLPRPYEGFPFDNVAGAGRALLQIDAQGTYGVAAEELPEALRHYLVFAGGWGSAQGGFALDLRVTDARGEHPIVPYDESEPPTADTPAVPATSFGHWLWAHVVELIEAVEPGLRRIQ